MLRIVRYLSKAEIGQMLVALVSIVGQIWLDLTLPDYMADITQLVETPGSEMHDIWVAGGKMLLVSLGSAACAVVTGFIAARVGASFSQRLRSLEFNKVESFGPAEMNRFSTASLITRSTNDITQIQMFITMGLMMIVKAPIMAVWAVCKIAGKGFDWTLATGIAVAILLVVIAVVDELRHAEVQGHAAPDRQHQPRGARERSPACAWCARTTPRTIRKPSSPKPTRNSPKPSCSPTVPWPS